MGVLFAPCYSAQMPEHLMCGLPFAVVIEQGEFKQVIQRTRKFNLLYFAFLLLCYR